ncbi:type I-E CRISPR-associated protein Cse1/CasA [Streptomyces verrucosisporus]|uniref:type I-E CRISPR-associated protein Cse1/CasA n=1 Tax=Streptomyces verrucosisporus TaxID=1695161 RepID=UPI001F126C5E|nr:type I-E CRISPR-associated protein Cse1/CasA [Streptomyces verrucosisporus]MBN3933040.1 type I-E CRISPR-associated protein Cse1/CasA [Streptomyces verrucosisporus]
MNDAVPKSGASFDLTSRPWLPVQYGDGREAELSLGEVFAQAADIRRLVGDLPTQEFALLRLLLAILHDAVDGPEDIDAWEELWRDGDSFDPVAEYLDRHRERFDLLHPRTPFFQVADLRTAGDEVFSLNRIVADVPNGEPFFTMRSLGVGRLGFAEAARWLVHAHAYDTSGIKSGAVGDPRTTKGKVYPQGVAWTGNLGGVHAEGGTLRETLLLNLIAADTGTIRMGEEDRPAWRREPCGPGPADGKDLAERPSGPRDLYTWQSRRVRLHHDGEDVHGVVLGYGDPLQSYEDRHRDEPMSGWRRSQAQEKKRGAPLVYMPQEHDPSRAAWRGLASLIAPADQNTSGSRDAPSHLRPRILDWVARLVTEGVLPDDHFLRARIVGAAYGTQQSVIDEVVDDGVTMAVIQLHAGDRRFGRTAVAAVQDADQAVRTLGDLADRLARAAGTEPEPRRSAARDLGYDALDAPFRHWLSEFRVGDDPQAKRGEWHRQTHRLISRLGDKLLDEAGTAAWEGRIGERGEWLNSAWADLRFRADLNKALPLASTSDDPLAPGGTDTPKAHA